MTLATGTAEREAALVMLGRRSGRRRATVGAAKACDTAAFVAALRASKVTPQRHPEHLGPPLGDRPPDPAPPRLRQRIEEGIKPSGGLRTTRHRGTARVGWMLTLTAAAGNLVRLPKLLQAA